MVMYFDVSAESVSSSDLLSVCKLVLIFGWILGNVLPIITSQADNGH